MIEPIADTVPAAWPVGLTLAFAGVAGVAERVRSQRRRLRLNRALHELRRPLQALALASSHRALAGRDQIDQALAALGLLDREVNGGRAEDGASPVEVRPVAAAAVARWQPAAAACGRGLSLSWNASCSLVRCDDAALSRALDNLLANSIEHGRGPIRVDGVVRAQHLRLLVADGADAGLWRHAPERQGEAELPLRRDLGRARHDVRRGHGLRLVADVAQACGGRFAACRHDAGATAVLELPLAPAR